MIPFFEWHVIQLGPIPVQVWGMWVALGILVSLIIIVRHSGSSSKQRDVFIDMAMWLLVGGFVGARLMHVFAYEPGYYSTQPFDIFAIWRGGFSSFGGFLGATAAFYFFVRQKKIPKSEWLSIADNLSIPAIVGWMIGRMGCFFIHDHWGKPCDCFLAVRSPDGSRLDMALLEILILVPLALFFLLTRKRSYPSGFRLSLLLIYYGVARFLLDFWRAVDIVGADTRYIGLTPAQYLSIVMAGCGVFICCTLIKQSKRSKSQADKQ